MLEITSVLYLLFVGISLLIYWFVPHKVQWVILLIDSLVFYFLNATWYTFAYLLVSVLSVYGAALLFRKTPKIGLKRLIFALTIVLNVGILVLLKYLNLFILSFNSLFGTSARTVNWLAPLAISYYMLQILSYLIDCYLETIEPEKNPLKLLLFSCFFPMMVSGPICRYSQTGNQLFEEHRFDYGRVLSAMRRVLWGLAKKLVVANNLALIVNQMFGNVELYSGPWVIVAAVLFVIQLYFDFSGCMDIVIGVAKCFGITLPENFNAPFLSKSVQEFWQRWHITLGCWLKDYIMFPISRTKAFRNWSKACKNKMGRNGQKIPYYLAMFVVWTLMGIWHGSSWKYVVGEGWFFWILIVLGQIFEPVSRKIKTGLRIKDENVFWRAFQVCRTFLLFALGNIAFKAASLPQTFHMIGRMFVWTGIMPQLSDIHQVMSAAGGVETLIVVAILIVIQIVSDFRTYQGKSTQSLVLRCHVVVRYILYILLVFTILLFNGSGQAAFVYFQF